MPLPLVAEVDGVRRFEVLVKDVLDCGDDVLQFDAVSGAFGSGLHDLVGFVGFGQFLLPVFLEEDAPGGAGFSENRALSILGVGDACSDSNHVRQDGNRPCSFALDLDWK